MAATTTWIKSPRLFIATIAISSSWTNIPLVESFSLRSKHQSQSMTTKYSAWFEGGVHHRNIHLPPKNRRPVASLLSHDALEGGEACCESVTGPIYEMNDGAFPTVKLFTKKGCTLCDKVKDVLESVREDHPHSLYAVDIADDDKKEWFSKYKYDIPVLHINDIYWTKHRLSIEDAAAGINEASAGEFATRQGEPDASRLEHN